ncbi:MAG: alpha/beta hydrolase family protein, partial [Pseudonocardiaceae bacterium]
LNQRGSSGYGAAHTLAIRGAWGGPDLDDICAVARALAAQRRALDAPGLMLLGASYGAFLALLAASCQPDLWSRCVVLAPFLSGPRLHQEAPGARGLIEQLGGLEALRDPIGPRDVLRLCHALRAKLLIIHGGRDDRIPVTQSRALRQRLLELGRREDVDFEYLEVPGGGHDLAIGAHTQALHERVARFLTATSSGPVPSTRCRKGEQP